MNREILFRGKRADNGKWVMGMLCQYHEWASAKIVPNDSGDFYSKMVWVVDPETVGQFTGLIDKNGVKIFEGDILKFKSGNYVVEWCNEHSKFLQADKQFTRELHCYIDNSEVIGNIHDNSETMEGEPNV